MEHGSSVSQAPAEPAEQPAELADLTGRVLGDFRIQRKLGQGGMGQVYLAEQQSLKRPVALKIMRPELAANPTALKRFQAEAEAVARVTHAHIVQVHAVGQVDGLHFMALEYVEGRNLRDFLSRKGVPDLPLALAILTQTASALVRAGESGIVHRDIKPENILLTRQGEVKVADFGLSRCLAPDQAPLHLTQTGVALGTPLYMSPEQVQGREIDPRSDIYSLGVTAYHLLAGEPPFRGVNAFDVAVQHVQKEPTPLRQVRPDLPAELCAIVHKMMMKQPADRYQSARDLLMDLAPLRDQAGATMVMPALSLQAAAMPPKPAVRRKPVALITATLLLAFAGGVGLRWWGTEPPVIAVPSPEPTPSLFALRERELQDTLRKPVDPRKIDQVGQHFETTIELGLLYLDERQLDKAQAYFHKLRNAANPKLYQAYGRIGQACVLAFQDQPKESNEIFTELERAKPQPWFDKFRPGPWGGPGPGPRPGPGSFRPSWKTALEYPEHTLLTMPEVRRVVAEALTFNAANLGVATLPDPLERLRKPPTVMMGKQP